MKTIRDAVGQMVLLLILGLVVGLAANNGRVKGHIDLGRDYVAQVPPPIPTTGPNQPPTSEPQFPYQVLSFEEATAAWKDPQTKVGLYVFLDARGDEAFEHGHIPGALQCDPYGSAATIDAIAGRVLGTVKVIAYCNGGACEDSILLCQELVKRGVPKETLYVFKGGWEEWTNGKMPVATGREE
jgi:3-mercaptopyruvate sulfurtransferase SseA